MPTLDPHLTDWLNHTVYPKLNHDLVLGNLPNDHGGPPTATSTRIALVVIVKARFTATDLACGTVQVVQSCHRVVCLSSVARSEHRK